MFQGKFIQKVLRRTAYSIDQKKANNKPIDQPSDTNNDIIDEPAHPVDKKELVLMMLAAFITYLPAIIVLIVVIALALLNIF